MAEQIPSNLIISDVSITNEHRIYTSKSISGIQYRKDSGIQKYYGTITLTASGFDSARILNGFLTKLKGRLNAFEIMLGGAYGYESLSDNPKLAASYNIGSDNISISSYSGDVTISAGSVFTLPNETKLYTILDDVSSAGNSTVDIIPSLKIQHSINETINFINPKFTVILDTNNTTITHTHGGLISSVTLNWTEELY